MTFHDAAGTRTIDVGLEGPQWKGHRQQHIDEQRGEDLRLAYVALTRAKHQAVVWWAGSWASRDSALSRLLFARDDEGNVAVVGRRGADRRRRRRARFVELADAAPGRVSVAPAVARADGVVAGRRGRDVGRCRRRRSTARSTGGGGARRSATSPPGPTSRTWRASRRSRSSTTSPAPHAPPVDDDGRRRAARGAVAARRDAGRGRGRDAGPPRVRGGGLRGGGPRRGAGDADRAPRRRGGGSSSVTSTRSSPGCARRSRRRSGRWPAASRCATSRAPTGSTSSTSSCRWSAATTRAARR